MRYACQVRWLGHGLCFRRGLIRPEIPYQWIYRLGRDMSHILRKGMHHSYRHDSLGLQLTQTLEMNTILRIMHELIF